MALGFKRDEIEKIQVQTKHKRVSDNVCSTHPLSTEKSTARRKTL